jgi:hypothetical protein
MFNSSNCDSSKNWLTQKYNCLTPFEQMSKKMTTGQKLKIICRTCIENQFQTVSILDKKLMTSRIATG